MVLDEAVKEFLNSAVCAMLPVRLRLGDDERWVLIVKSTGDVLREIKGSGSARIAWAVSPTESGPVCCAILDARSGETARLTVETWFDPFDDWDDETLRSMAAQERLDAALFDEEMDLVGLVGVRWGEVERLALEQAIDRGEELAEDALMEGVEPDFDRACDIFRAETTIEKLAAKLLSDDSD